MRKNHATWYCYKLTNLINNKIYIGKTFNIKYRLVAHIKEANSNPKTYLHRAMFKYGVANFAIEEIYSSSSEEEAFAKEIELIKKYKSNNENVGYNLTGGGAGGVYQNKSVIDKIKITCGNNSKFNSKITYLIRNRVLNGERCVDISEDLNINVSSVWQMTKGIGRFAKFTKVPAIIVPVRELFGLNDEVINNIREDFIKDNNITNTKLINKYKKFNVCSKSIMKILCAQGRFSHLEPLREKKVMKLDRSTIDAIITDLKDMRQIDVARKFNLSRSAINVIYRKNLK